MTQGGTPFQGAGACEYNIGELIILSLDTTTRAGSAAVLRGDDVLAEITGDPALTHGARLPSDLMRVLELASVGLDNVALLAVAAGPGSFTGMRVGIATMQGLAMAAGIRIVAVSTLEALARAGTNRSRLIGAWMDAQRGEVYATLYAPDGRDVRIAPLAATPRAILDAWADTLGSHEVVFIGDGAVRYSDAIVTALGARATVVPPPALAGLIGQIAAADPGRAVVPHAVVPIYVRKSDAELARDRRADA
jgi:tRNA threonylcarbamoyladenosine biosynthesis protein TsaB